MLVTVAALEAVFLPFEYHLFFFIMLFYLGSYLISILGLKAAGFLKRHLPRF